MAEEAKDFNLAAFTGQWVGETQGWEMPAHLWEIQQQGDYLHISTRWEGESRTTTFYAQGVADKAAFKITGLKAHNIAILVDKQHFVIAGWCLGSAIPNVENGRFDVVFSRPGIAELTARAAYLKSLQAASSDDDQT